MVDSSRSLLNLLYLMLIYLHVVVVDYWCVSLDVCLWLPVPVLVPYKLQNINMVILFLTWQNSWDGLNVG